MHFYRKTDQFCCRTNILHRHFLVMELLEGKIETKFPLAISKCTISHFSNLKDLLDRGARLLQQKNPKYIQESFRKLMILCLYFTKLESGLANN